MGMHFCCMFIILSGPAFTFGGDCGKYLCATMLRDFPKFANLERPVFNRNVNICLGLQCQNN